MRSSVAGPKLPRLRTRIDDFENAISSTVDYLHGLWTEELEDLRIEVADLPIDTKSNERLPRWSTFPSQKRIVFYRLPIERLSRLHRNDDPHRRMFVEGIVFQAVAELIGKDPWELAPDRFRFH